MAANASTASLFAAPRARFVVAGIVTVVLAIGWKLWNMEWIEQKSDPFFTREANENPYLAAHLFLSRLGHHVKEGDNKDALDDLPQQNATLLLASGRAHLTEKQQQVLLDWVEHGGHLVTLATREWNDKTESIDDLLQRRFDVAAVRTGDASMEFVNLLFQQNGEADDTDTGSENTEVKHPDDGDTQNNNDEQTPSSTGSTDAANDSESSTGDDSDDATVVMSDTQCLTQVPFGATEIDWLDGQRLVADIGGKMRMEVGDVEPLISAADSLGLQLVQFEFGKGKVTFMTSMLLWNNRQISNFDNAHLLALLTDDAPDVVILYNFDAVPLTDLLKHFFPATLIMMVVLAIMVIYHYQLRWGAPSGVATLPRRSLLQHIRASGRLLWQHQQLGAMIARLQQQIIEQLTRLHPGPTSDRDALLQQLTAKTGIAKAKIDLAMGDTPARDDELLEQIRLLQTIRNSL